MIRILVVIALALPLCAQVKVTQHGNKTVAVEVDGKPFTDFYVANENGALKPYLHPLRAASGTVVTRGYPMLTDVPGEAHDHAHHRGLWFAHGDVNGLDFWGGEVQKDPAKRGVISLVKIDGVHGGKKAGDVEATFHWAGTDGKPLLTEKRKMVFGSSPNERVMDFDITLQADQKVKFGDTKEGTFAIRLASALEEPQRRSPASPKRTGKMVDAEGRSGEAQVWGKRSPWVDYAGEIEGEKLGIAIFDHPRNPRHPTYWHSRSYGLFAANIFGVHDFENDKSKDGSMTLEPGESLRFRYRVIIHAGDLKSADIPGQYRQYSSEK